MSCGMVPDGLAFQLGRNGVSLTLSFLLLRLSRLAEFILRLSSSTPGRSSTARIRPLSNQRSRLLWLQYITSTISPANARVSMVGWYCAHGIASYFTWPVNFWL